MYMNEEEMRLAIHQFMGWQWQSWGRNQVQVFAPKDATPNWFGHDVATNSMKWSFSGQSVDDAARDLIFRVTANPLECLNAMHEAEQNLTKEEAERYDYLLFLECGGGYLWRATAAQKAKCFVEAKAGLKKGASR